MIKSKLRLFIFLAAVICACAVITYFVIPFFAPHVRSSRAYCARQETKQLAYAVEEYFRTHKSPDKHSANITNDVIEFCAKKLWKYTRFPEGIERDRVEDLDFCLNLPDHIPGDNPVLLGFVVGSFNSKKMLSNKPFYIVLFLRNRTVSVVCIPAEAFEKLVGKDKLTNSSPNLFFRRLKKITLSDYAPQDGQDSSQRQPRMDRPMTGTLKLGSKTLPLVFEDGDHTEELRKVIIADMNLIFGHLGDYQFLKLHEPVWFVIGGRKIEAAEHIHLKSPGVFRPETYKAAKSGLVVRLDGKRHLVVSRELLKAYRKALEFKKKNVKMFAQLEKFIETFNRHHGLPRLTADEIDDYFWFEKDALSKRKLWRENPDKFINQPKNWNLGLSSLLNIKTSPEFGFGDDLDLFVAVIYARDDKGIPENKLYLIYHKGRWKILIVDYGT